MYLLLGINLEEQTKEEKKYQEEINKAIPTSYADIGYTELMEKTDLKSDTVEQGILPSRVSDYVTTVVIDEAHVATSNGTLTSGVYTSTERVYYDDTNRSIPPKGLVFRNTMSTGLIDEAIILPAYNLVYDSSLLFGLGGFRIVRWSRADVYPDYTDVVTYSIDDYSETHSVQILADKTDATREY